MDSKAFWWQFKEPVNLINIGDNARATSKDLTINSPFHWATHAQSSNKLSIGPIYGSWVQKISNDAGATSKGSTIYSPFSIEQPPHNPVMSLTSGQLTRKIKLNAKIRDNAMDNK
jgi:hypothetical protein